MEIIIWRNERCDRRDFSQMSYGSKSGSPRSSQPAVDRRETLRLNQIKVYDWLLADYLAAVKHRKRWRSLRSQQHDGCVVADG